MKQPNEPDYPVIVYLTEPEVRFVSLVKRGANRTPFHIAKQDKETEPMRIIQRIIAKKGTPIDAIQKAVGEEASDLLKLDAPTENGAFTVYDQYSKDAFKADTLEVVSLSDDNSIVCLCGELAKKSEGFISKLLDKKEAQTGIEIPQEMKSASLKGDCEALLFDELHAMESAIAGILGQPAQTNKVELVRSVCDNFAKSLETAIEVTKSDLFLPPKQEEGTEIKEGEEMKPENQDVPKEANKAEAMQAQKTEAMLASLDSLKQQFEAMKSELEALKKAPVAVVSSHADNPSAQKSEEKTSNMFAGVFGNFSRLR